jgi:hypothetical protein
MTQKLLQLIHNPKARIEHHPRSSQAFDGLMCCDIHTTHIATPFEHVAAQVIQPESGWFFQSNIVSVRLASGRCVLAESGTFSESSGCIIVVEL